MQHKSSIGSRITWFVIAVAILVATCLMGLRVLPVFESVFASFGSKLPRGTQAVLTFGPAVLVSVGVLAAFLMIMGEFRPALRGLRPPLILLVLFLIASSLATVLRFGSTLSVCGTDDIINLSAPASTSPTQSTNAP
jgi:hypothetical protein